MTPWIIRRRIDMERWQRGVEVLGVLAYSGDMRGHRLELELYAGDAQADMTGYTARAYFLLGHPSHPDQMVLETASASGNRVVVTFPDAAYIDDQGSVVVCAERAEERITLYAGTYRVRCGAVGVVIDPNRIVPSLPALLAQMDALRSTTAAGQAQQRDADAAEQKRAAAETGRADAEQKRAAAETGRADAEKKRATAETGRADAEQKRVTAETGRADAEKKRAAAETGRADAEQKRAAAHATAMQESSTQSDRAKAAADQLSELAVEVQSLPPSSDPTSMVTREPKRTTISLGIPTSNFAYATFYINPDTRQLVMRVPNGFSAIQFAIHDRRLVVRINGE